MQLRRRHVAAFDVVVAAVLVVLAFRLRRDGIGPDSLWLDDAWVAVAARQGGLDDLFRTSLTSPGFSGVLWGLFSVFGFSEVAAQLPALVAGCVAPAVLYLGASRVGISRAAALLGSAILVTAPNSVQFSLRTKQYTIEIVASLVLLLLATSRLRSPSDRRLRSALAVAAVISVVISGALAFTAVPVVGVVSLVCLWRAPDDRRAEVATTATVAAVLGLWYLTVIRAAENAALTEYWRAFYLELDSTIVSQVRTGWTAVLDGLVPHRPTIVVVVIVVGVVMAVRDRAFVVAVCVAPLVLVLGAAVVDRAPFGGGRTDMHLYGAIVFLCTVAADALIGAFRERRVRGVVAGAATGLALLLVATQTGRARYPQEDVRAFVERSQRDAGDDTTIVVYPLTQFAYALYAGEPVDFTDSDVFANGFEVSVDDPRVVVLDPAITDPADYRPVLRAATAGKSELILVGSHLRPDRWNGILAAAQDEGFEISEQADRTGAAYVELRRVVA